MSEKAKKWLKATAIRTIKTMAETFSAMVSVAVVISEVDWIYVGSATLLSGIITIATCVKGLPEAEI